MSRDNTAVHSQSQDVRRDDAKSWKENTTKCEMTRQCDYLQLYCVTFQTLSIVY